MKYRKVAKNGDELSVLGYGCMRLPTKAGRIDKDRALSQIRGAIDRGVNYIDTAYPYHAGESESFLGKYVLKDGYREKVKVATKLPVFLVKKNEDMMKYFEKQREKLQIEIIDYYLLHMLNGDSWAAMKSLGIISFMDQLKKDGKIFNMGFSFHGKVEDFKKIIDDYDWDFCQIQLNILDENYQAGIEGLNYASERDIAVIIMEPLRGGQLVKMIPKEVKKLWDTADVKYTPAEWALRWLWNLPNVTMILSGMNVEEHIDENIKIAGIVEPDHLTEKELEIINQVKEQYQKLLEIDCTGCGYCSVCPAGINIPYAFQTYNNAKMFSKMQHLGMYAGVVGLTKEVPKWTTTCLDCGLCESHCPQFIPIRQEFKKVQSTIETPIVRGLVKVIRPFAKSR
ncbi:MAG: aldo/keto reductase [Clostridiales bacterium]|nr:aldo/keto reductase [Clostridiales bacterium]